MKILPLLALTLCVPAVALTTRALEPGVAPSAGLAAPRVEAAKFKIDNVHSSVLFRVKHFGVSNFYGRFNKLSGAITWDAAQPEASSIAIEVDAGSVDSGSADRDTHLRNSDFLSTKEFPTISFKSKTVKKSGDKLEVSGDLSLHGVTKSVKASVEFTGEGESPYGYRAGFEASFDIKRSDFGVAGYPDAIGDDVRLIVALEAVKA